MSYDNMKLLIERSERKYFFEKRFRDKIGLIYMQSCKR